MTYILEDLPSALCRLYERHVVIEGQLLGGVEDTPPLLSQVLWLKLYSVSEKITFLNDIGTLPAIKFKGLHSGKVL